MQCCLILFSTLVGLRNNLQYLFTHYSSLRTSKMYIMPTKDQCLLVNVLDCSIFVITFFFSQKVKKYDESQRYSHQVYDLYFVRTTHWSFCSNFTVYCFWIGQNFLFLTNNFCQFAMTSFIRKILELLEYNKIDVLFIF